MRNAFIFSKLRCLTEFRSEPVVFPMRVMLSALLLCCTALAQVVVADAKPRPNTHAETWDAAEGEFTSNAAPVPVDDIKVRVLTLRPRGFEPKEITFPEGRFLLVVNNRSGVIGELLFVLENLTGVREREVSLRKGWRGMLDLPVGEYRLVEANHPRWTCKITVRPRN